MKNIIIAATLVLLCLVSFNSFANSFTEPTADPVRIIQQQKILLVDEVLAETRTFRYAAGVVGAGVGVAAGASAASAAGVAVVPAAVAGGIIYGAAFYGSSTLGVELAYQVTAQEIRDKRDAAIASGRQQLDSLTEKGKDILQKGKEGVQNFLNREWF